MRAAMRVNATGLAEIKAFLAENHRLGGDHFTDKMILAWAAEAEFQIGEGNPASIEVRSFDSVSGHTVTYDISEAGQDWGEVWEAWEDGKRDEAERFLVPLGGTFDVAQAGADALGVEVSEALNVARV